MARILFLTALYPPVHRGGYEMTCHDVAQAFRARGHETLVLTGEEPVTGSGRSTPDPDWVCRVLRVGFDGERLTAPRLDRRLQHERWNQKVLADALERFRPDVVSAWHMAGVPIGLLTTVVRRHLPLVCVVCDEWPVYLAHTDPWLGLWVRWTWLQAWAERTFGIPSSVPGLDDTASFCFVSHRTRDRCLKGSPWLFPLSTVTYSGIDENDFPVERRQPRSPWDWSLVCAGRLDPRKGFSTAIAALEHLPPTARLRILSPADSPYRIELQAVAERCGVADRVSFAVSDRSRLRTHYLQADAVIFPSIWDEPFGLVPLEAMAVGTPVIATGVGGSGEFLVDDQNCVRFRAEDPADLAGAIRRLAGSLELRRRVLEGGWRTASELTMRRLVDALEEWHLGAVDGFRAGVPRARDLRAYKSAKEDDRGLDPR